MFATLLKTKSTGCTCDMTAGICRCGGAFMGQMGMALEATTLEAAKTKVMNIALEYDARRPIVSAQVFEVTGDVHDLLPDILIAREARIVAIKTAQYNKLKTELGL